MYLGRGDRERRHQHDGVAKGTKEHAALRRRRADSTAQTLVVSTGREFDAPHQAVRNAQDGAEGDAG